MGSMHVDGVKVDQIKNTTMERVEIVEVNVVMVEEFMHGGSIFNE